MPETSIIIRTFNEEKHIGNLLQAIKQQNYKNYEVIVIDSESTDRTVEIAEKFSVKIIKIKSRDFTFGYALNIGCNASSGKYLVFVSAHIIPIDNKWLSNLLAPFNSEKVAMVYGKQKGNDKSKFSEKMDFKRIFGNSQLNSKVPINYANNANSAIKKEFWEKRPFDEYLFGLEDINWAKGMTQEGHLIHYEPKASIYHIHEEEWHQVFNRYRREAIAAVRVGLAHPPQVKLGIKWMFVNLFLDILKSFPNFTPARIEEIVRFRYYQWKGSKAGWFQGKDLDLKRDRNSVFRPSENMSVVIGGKDKAELEEVPLPEMKPGDILIKVDYVGVCGTDIEVFEGTLGYYRDNIASYPIVPGHEFSGTIAKIGSNNKFQERFKLGQRVVGECILFRGENSERREVGVINYNGAYSKFIVMPGDFIHKIPDDLDSKTAALAEPLAVVLRALRRVANRMPPMSSIAVVGAGPIGNLCSQILYLKGYKVSVFDKNQERLKLLRDKSISVFTSLKNLEKFDVIIEVTGSEDALKEILSKSRVDSTILLLGFPYREIKYNFEDVVGKEKVIIGSVGAEREDFQKAMEIFPKLDMMPFTQVVMPLKSFNKAWNEQRLSKNLKILLKP